MTLQKSLDIMSRKGVGGMDSKRKIFQEACEIFGFLDSLTREQKELFMENMDYSRYEPGRILTGVGSPCSGMVLVLSGVVRVYKISEDGREITLYRIGRGETCILTVSCMMGNLDYQAVAQVEEEAGMLTLPVEIFRKILMDNSAFQQFIFGTLTSRLAEVMMVVEETVFHSMDRRIAAYLVETAGRSGNSIRVTHEEIAMELGTAREVVSRILKEFEKRGYVALARGVVEVREPGSLRKLGSL